MWNIVSIRMLFLASRLKRRNTFVEKLKRFFILRRLPTFSKNNNVDEKPVIHLKEKQEDNFMPIYERLDYEILDYEMLEGSPPSLKSSLYP